MRKVKNKERCAYRGQKVRYSVWRAKYNLFWERFHEEMVRQICADNDLPVEPLPHEKKRRLDWEKTQDELEHKGYHLLGHSIREIQTRVEVILGFDHKVGLAGI
ncbi:MAG: hypothetical protein M0R80_02360 [Proteobacteria bacterium]|jgi:hypothetical protein|nr:hypothetical protein [Pseudomonadota bacterium]